MKQENLVPLKGHKYEEVHENHYKSWMNPNSQKHSKNLRKSQIQEVLVSDEEGH